jgi:hypothetical protein
MIGHAHQQLKTTKWQTPSAKQPIAEKISML